MKDVGELEDDTAVKIDTVEETEADQMTELVDKRQKIARKNKRPVMTLPRDRAPRKDPPHQNTPPKQKVFEDLYHVTCSARKP